MEGRDGPVDGQFDNGETAAELLRRLAGYLSTDDNDFGVAHAKLVTHIWSSTAIGSDIAAVTGQRHAALRDHLIELMADDSAGSKASGRAEVLSPL